MQSSYQTILFATQGGAEIDLAKINRYFGWELLSCVERRYEDARWKFSRLQARRQEKEEKRGHPCPLSATMLTAMSIALFSEAEELDAEHDKGDVVSERDPEKDGFRRSRAGRPGEPFLPMLKAILFAPYLGVEQNAEQIAFMLRSNLQYQILCNFRKGVPSARALRRFRQILYTYGLWGDIKRLIVLANLERGVFDLPDHIAVDSTHLDAFASVNRERKACKECPKGERCPTHQTTCDVTGIVSKSKNYKLPGVKGTIIVSPDSEIPIEAVAGEGNRHDSKLLEDSLRQLVKNYPFLKKRIEKVLADRAYDCKRNRQEVREHLDAELVTPINERNRKDTPVAYRGIRKIDKQGRPHCIAGHRMALAGRDTKREQFIWRCPVFAKRYVREGLQCPPECKAQCAPEADEGRTFRLHRSLVPQINWNSPQHLASTELLYNLRTSVERCIGRGKRGFQFERFFGRGRLALQGHLDRFVIAVNLFAFVAWEIGREDLLRSCRLSAAG